MEAFFLTFSRLARVLSLYVSVAADARGETRDEGDERLIIIS